MALPVEPPKPHPRKMSEAPRPAVDKSANRVRRMFGRIAPRYDFLNHLLSLNVDRLWRRATVRSVAPEGPLPILDVCTGTGDLAIAYERAARGTTHVVATDFCHEMLQLGYAKGERLVDGRIRFIEADTLRLPFAGNQYQIVAVAFGLRNVADTDAGLAEMVRVCAEGGRVAVLEFSRPGWRPFRVLYGWYFHRILPRIGQWFSRSEDSAYRYLPTSVGQFPDGDALAERMQRAGLADVWHRPLTLGIATLYVGTKPAKGGSESRDQLPLEQEAPDA